MLPDESVKDAKSRLRKEIRLRRRNRPAGEREAATAGLTKQLIALVRERSPQLVGCYLSGGDEPDTRPFLSWAAANGVDVLVPVSRADGLLDWVYVSDEPEQIGLFGISEMVGQPVPASVFESVDLLLVPAAAVDRTGMRMGWGRGYFDRALGAMARRPPVFAVIHDEEFLVLVPREDHDLPVDGVVMPSGTQVF